MGPHALAATLSVAVKERDVVVVEVIRVLLWPFIAVTESVMQLAKVQSM